MSESQRYASCKCGHPDWWHAAGVGICEVTGPESARCTCSMFDHAAWIISEPLTQDEIGLGQEIAAQFGLLSEGGDE